MTKVINLPFEVKRPILACGADLKGAFAMARGKRAVLVGGFGDLADLDNLTRYEKEIAIYNRRFKVRRGIIACDLHPEYISSRYAEASTASRQMFKIQHHEAHVASAIVDNSINGPVIGVAFDGTGFGRDGRIWGGEFFVGGLKRLNRVAHLAYQAMPGGEAAVREPWRMAASYLYSAFGKDFLRLKIDFVKKMDKSKWSSIRRLIDRGINSPFTSSMGRLFDAAGSLILARMTVWHEAELPIELEKMAGGTSHKEYEFNMERRDGVYSINPYPAIKGLVDDISKGVEGAVVSLKFHNTVVSMITRVSSKLRRDFGVDRVVLSGGVFQNRYLVVNAAEALKRNGFKVYTHSQVAASDQGIPIGQIAIANSEYLCA